MNIAFERMVSNYQNEIKQFNIKTKREKFDFLKKELDNFNIVLIGLRQIGKTTLAKQLVKEYINENKKTISNELLPFKKSEDFLYLNMKAITEINKIDLHNFITSNVYKIVFLDEIQAIKEWSDFAQALIDANPKTRFIFTGSNTRALTRETMINRAKIYILNPLSFKEFKNIWNIDDFETYIKFGSYPKFQNYNNPSIQYMEIVDQQIIDRVIVDDSKVPNVSKFKFLMKKMVNYIGNDLKISELADGEISRPTATNYLALMEFGGLIKRIYKYDDKSDKAIGKAYFKDKSMVFRFNDYENLNNNLQGSFIENIVFNHLEDQFNMEYLSKNIYVYRDGNNKEIDFIIPNNKILIEVKYEDHLDVDAFIKKYDGRITENFRDFKKIAITKNTKIKKNGWSFVPLIDLLEGDINEL